MKIIIRFFIFTSIILFFILSCGNTKNKTPKDISYSSNFTRDNNKQIIIDKRLNKIWQDNEDVIALDKNYNEAIIYCNSLSLAGYDDWYLPKFNDMISMLNTTSKSIDGSFKNINPNIIKYWVSDIVDYKTDYHRPKFAWFVDGIDVVILQGIKEASLSVRCIRDNK